MNKYIDSKVSDLYSMSFYPEINLFHIYNTREAGKESVRLMFSDGWVLQELIHNWTNVPGYSRKKYRTPEEALDILGGSLVYEIGNKIRELIKRYAGPRPSSDSLVSAFRRRSKRRFSTSGKRFSNKVGKHNKRHSRKKRKARSRKKVL